MTKAANTGAVMVSNESYNTKPFASFFLYLCEEVVVNVYEGWVSQRDGRSGRLVRDTIISSLADQGKVL